MAVYFLFWSLFNSNASNMLKCAPFHRIEAIYFLFGPLFNPNGQNMLKRAPFHVSSEKKKDFLVKDDLVMTEC